METGWHPERIEPRKSDDGILVVGGDLPDLSAHLLWVSGDTELFF
ncbi:MAG: hypothetical protein Ct9H300mP28_34970 [Pseudomonadota bacterium]|nr:MAG: hypothetical protein Ct9H300mP28_34970 [Pseudomonadota bacterium]